MPDTNTPEIIDILLSQNIIDAAKLEEARNESIIKQIPVDRVLIEKSWITLKDIVKAKSVIYGIPYVDISNATISKELINLVPEAEALKAKIIFFEASNGVYKAAMANPLDIQTIRYFESKLKGRIIVYIALEEDVLLKLKNNYSKSMGTEFTNVVEQAVSSSDFVDITVDPNESLNSLDINNAPVAKIVNMILESAVRDKASDIHIEPQEKIIRVRLRIHGILREVLTLPPQVGPSLVSRIKIMGKMPIDEKRKPLDGRFQVRSDNQEIDLRISSLPTVIGEKIVIRLLRKDLGILSLEDTGMRGNALKVFMEGLKATAGIILVTGPTGSGKTVTVATCMNLLNRPEVNVVSIEDPVEIKIPGVNQVQVNGDAGLTFATALRAFLRQDPNIISVGEIRDAETAALAAQASLTGHLVVSTLHTNSAAGVLPRLLDMNIEPYIIASTVNICSAQRLCRKICSNCIQAYTPDEAELLELRRIISASSEFHEENYIQFQRNVILKNLKISETAILQTAPDPTKVHVEQPVAQPAAATVQAGMQVQAVPGQVNQIQIAQQQMLATQSNSLVLFKGKGCDRCDGTGYNGRIGIFEVFRVTEKIGSLVMQHASSEEIEREAIKAGMIKMIQDGYFKCLDGVTTLEEVQRVIHA
jgi:type IV pilus assembly protein PilB